MASWRSTSSQPRDAVASLCPSNCPRCSPSIATGKTRNATTLAPNGTRASDVRSADRQADRHPSRSVRVEALLREAGVRDARLHDARHTAATTLLLLSVPERAVMDFMGWSNAAMIKRYAHVTARLRRDIADRLNAYLWVPKRLAAARGSPKRSCARNIAWLEVVVRGGVEPDWIRDARPVSFASRAVSPTSAPVRSSAAARRL